MTTTLYCKSTSRAKYLFIVDIRDALLISWHKAHKWLLTKKTWEKTSFALRLLIWADLQNHSEWKEGRGDWEPIHIFGVKYPGCQIIWQVTRASVFTARPSADSKPLRAFGPPAPSSIRKLWQNPTFDLSWEANTGALFVKHFNYARQKVIPRVCVVQLLDGGHNFYEPKLQNQKVFSHRIFHD